MTVFPLYPWPTTKFSPQHSANSVMDATEEPIANKQNTSNCMSVCFVFLCYAIIGKSNFFDSMRRCASEFISPTMYFNLFDAVNPISIPFFIIIVIESTVDISCNIVVRAYVSLFVVRFRFTCKFVDKAQQACRSPQYDTPYSILGECVSVYICVGFVCASTRKPFVRFLLLMLWGYFSPSHAFDIVNIN